MCATCQIDGIAEVGGIHTTGRASQLREHMVHAIEQVFEVGATRSSRQEESGRLVDLPLDLEELIDQPTSSMVCERDQLGRCAHERQPRHHDGRSRVAQQRS